VHYYYYAHEEREPRTFPAAQNRVAVAVAVVRVRVRVDDHRVDAVVAVRQFRAGDDQIAAFFPGQPETDGRAYFGRGLPKRILQLFLKHRKTGKNE